VTYFFQGEQMNFDTFNFHAGIVAGINALGYTQATPIQVQAIPPILRGRDIIGLAQTGTGKTAAFALPILQRLLPGARNQVRALVLSPTRELSEQINDAFIGLGKGTDLRSNAVYGGTNMEQQIRALQRGCEIVIACPGRLLDHLWRGSIDLSHVEMLVIDEADRMFDMGFLPDIRRIVSCLTNARQTMLFSATMPPDIRKLVQEVLHDPVMVQIGVTRPAVTVSHALYPVSRSLKTKLLKELLHQTRMESVLVFTRTKHAAERVTQQLARAGYRATSLHGNLSQNRRQAALDGFREGRYHVLVATDIAARGIDISDISHVINYDMPESTDAYIHRIGRTGRVGKSGDAFTLVTGEDKEMVQALEKLLRMPLQRVKLDNFDYSEQVIKEVQKPLYRTRRQPVMNRNRRYN
jgi:ATP-dependent RNA helicase RhlE